jgi:hypothetical protein
MIGILSKSFTISLLFDRESYVQFIYLFIRMFPLLCRYIFIEIIKKLNDEKWEPYKLFYDEKIV